MSKILIVTKKPYFKNTLEKKYEQNSNYCFDFLQPVFNIKDKNIKIDVSKDGVVSINDIERKTFVPFELAFFPNIKGKYVIDVTDKVIEESEYDYILFACDNCKETLYSIVEYCERNFIPLDKILYKNLSIFDEASINDIENIENTHFLLDMSIDDFSGDFSFKDCLS